ncbi:MAG: carbon-nitrogen hydrolase family protein [Bryobacterales bacterium]|nr:carbon-nitrogen hydrolase family protein [Bryobacterales bacterium]
MHVLGLSGTAVLAFALPALAASPGGWSHAAPRSEIEPRFSYMEQGGRGGKGAFVAEAGGRDGVNGYWSRTFPVAGGKHYRFRVYRRTERLEWPQQSTPVTVEWLDPNGRQVLDDRPLAENFLKGFAAWTPPEYPTDQRVESGGWTEVAGAWPAPSTATQAVLKMYFRWDADGRVEWSDPVFEEAAPPAGRKVRLAAVHYRPREGRTPEEKRRQFAPLIREAGRRKADLVVLPETLTYFQSGAPMAAAAEPVPGPSTVYFGELARENNLYIVAGLVEREGHLVYNVAVLIGPDGKVAGKYRKVTLPDGEANGGVTPGRDYPVFSTRFGTLGMMICYDGFFPEVARELTKRGAEVIAWPVWGCNPDLARARAVENHVYLVSSTYEDVSRNWMLTAVWAHTGELLSLAKDWGTLAVAEVDLNATTRWRSLGDFKSKLQRHVPMIPAAPAFEPAPRPGLR